MTIRTHLWGQIGLTALQNAKNTFKSLPPLKPSPPVGLVGTDEAWGVPPCDMLIAHDLPSSMIGLQDRAQATVINGLLAALPNTQQYSRWDRDTATRELVDIFGGEHRPNFWDDWHTDEAFARTFVQGPNAGDLHQEEEGVFVVDASVLALGERRKGVAPLGVKIAIAVESSGPRPLWIRMEDGKRVHPHDGKLWDYAKIVAGAAMQNYIGMVRHVLYLHYIAAQSMGVLVHNNLSWNHPLHRLLYPHVAGSLAVNWTANMSFMWPARIAEDTYAFTWKGLQDLVPIGFRAFDWDAYNMPDVFRARGTQELIDRGLYPYGEDAQLIWSAIDSYVGDYLSQYYPDDASVANDIELQGGLVSLDTVLPKRLRAKTLAELRLILTRYIHMVSAEHKLVSGIAYDFFTHPYWFPTLARVADNAEDAVPYREEAEQNLMFRCGISAMSWKLMADWTYVALDPKGAAAMRRFQHRLAEIGREIDARNTRRKVPFPYFHPEQLESSVAV